MWHLRILAKSTQRIVLDLWGESMYDVLADAHDTALNPPVDWVRVDTDDEPNYTVLITEEFDHID